MLSERAEGKSDISAVATTAQAFCPASTTMLPVAMPEDLERNVWAVAETAEKHSSSAARSESAPYHQKPALRLSVTPAPPAFASHSQFVIRKSAVELPPPHSASPLLRGELQLQISKIISPGHASGRAGPACGTNPSTLLPC